jgi:cytochrome c peroxidase
MHNGVFATLEEVVEFYNRGGGAGLGLPIDHQTLPFDHLTLTKQEKEDLVAFMHSLTDTSTVFSAPRHLPAFPAKTKLAARPIGGSY